MVENFRSRMGDLRQEIDRIASQAEELERVVQEQQVRLEEMDVLVRQRDEQLAEQQAHVEGLESALRQRDEELTLLRAQVAEKDQALAENEMELATLRARLAEREAAESALREELAQLRQAPAVEGVPIQALLERFAVLESLVSRQGDFLITLRSLIQEEMARLHGRLDLIETRLAAVPPAVEVRPVEVAPPVEEARPAVEAPPIEVAPPVEEALPAVEAPPIEVAPPVEEALPAVEAPPIEVAPPAEEALPAVEALPIEVAPPVEEALPAVEIAEADSLQIVLQESLEMLPAATLVGLAGRDGLIVEALVRRDPAFALPLELELADLTTEASRVAAALNTGPLLTVAFQVGNEHLLLAPVGQDHFAYLLTPADSPADFQRAQAVLLQTVSQLNDLS